jgi:hypothetical protein
MCPLNSDTEANSLNYTSLFFAEWIFPSCLLNEKKLEFIVFKLLNRKAFNEYVVANWWAVDFEELPSQLLAGAIF